MVPPPIAAWRNCVAVEPAAWQPGMAIRLRIASMRWLIGILLALFLGLQYRLWWGEGGIRERDRLEAEVAVQQERNQELEMRNRKLADEVDLLKSGVGVEERARRDLGLIGEGEVFYMLLDKPVVEP